MRRRSFLLGAAALLALAGTVEARVHTPYRGHRIVAASSAPLDGFSTPSGAYSFRKLRSAYAGNAVLLRRVDTTTQNIGFVGSDFDTAAAAVFCTTACTVQTFYDQSGNNRNLTQATPANQPAYVASCANARPCIQVSTLGQAIASTSFTPATGLVSMSAVAQRTGGLAACMLFRENGSAATANRLGTTGTGGIWTLFGGTSGNFTAPAAEGGWHAAQAVMNGAASVLNIDGAETTGSTTGGTTAGNIILDTAATGATCSITEAVFWDNYGLTGPERTALANNQRDYYAPYPLDAFAAPAAAYSVRKLKFTYSGPALRLRRASDDAEADINFLGFVAGTGSPIDVAQANAHCAATSCFVAKWYDQSGNARHAEKATPASQPALIFDCKASLPCLDFGAAYTLEHVSSMTPVMPVTFSAVATRGVSGTALCYFNRQQGAENWFGSNNSAANQWLGVGSGSTYIAPAAADAAWHAGMAVVNGASSVARIDGSETAGTLTGSVSAGWYMMIGLAGSGCRIAENVLWNGYGLGAGERAALQANQKSFWGTP